MVKIGLIDWFWPWKPKFGHEKPICDLFGPFKNQNLDKFGHLNQNCNPNKQNFDLEKQNFGPIWTTFDLKKQNLDKKNQFVTHLDLLKTKIWTNLDIETKIVTQINKIWTDFDLGNQKCD